MNPVYSLLKWKYRHSAAKYRRGPAQEELLQSLLAKNRNSAYGREYSFSEIATGEDFRARVPIVEYDDLEPWITRIAQGEKAVLTEEPVLLFEPTGGSSGKRKWIPYTQTLKEQFQTGVEAWLYDIYSSYSGLSGGKAYWMITPPFQEEEESSQIPVGFEDDGEYLGAVGKRIMERIMVTPKITPGMSTEEFSNTTLVALLQEPDLRLISIWNPSLLVRLLDYLAENTSEILRKLPEKRKQIVLKAVEERTYEGLWERLGMISCWADASAEGDAKKLAALFPHTVLQPKGLLSTECMVSFPTKESLSHGGMLPAFAGTYLEFRQEERIYSLEEIEEDAVYEVITTTGGGLYRYRSGDLVRVTGRLRGIPLLRFESRTQTVDLVGEKLTPGFVEAVFADLAGFYLLTPEEKGYVLFTSAEITPADADARLLENHHYRLARRLGQLKAVRVFRITGDAPTQYLENCVRHGQRLGDIKPVHLSGRTDFTFTGDYHD